MTAVVMVYAAAIGVMLAIAGLGLERIAAIARWPRRGVWAALVMVNVGLASMPWWRPADELTPISISIKVTTASAGATADSSLAPSVVERLRIAIQDASVQVAQWERAAVWIWGIGAAGVGAMFFVRVFVLSGRRRQWREAVVDETAVFVAPTDGPGVSGLLAPRIVLPEWAVSLDAHERTLILRHEHEHLIAHDPLLIQLAAISVLLMPWNPGAWWMLSRLRLAVEIDCDARVLRRSAGSTDTDAAQYAELLLTVALHRSGLPALTVPAMLEPPSSLGRRIAAMTPMTVRFRRIQVAFAGATALAIFAVLFAVPVPRLRAQTASTPEPTPAPNVASLPNTPTAPRVATLKDNFPEAARANETQAPPPAAPAPVEQATQVSPEKPEDEFGKGAYKLDSGSDIKFPELIKQVNPRYTSEPMNEGLQGGVTLDAVVKADGTVDETRVRSISLKDSDGNEGTPESRQALIRSAREALSQWLFKPATLNGVAVPVIVEIQMTFRLR